MNDLGFYTFSSLTLIMQCDFCHFNFTSAGHYGRHLRSKHPDKRHQQSKQQVGDSQRPPADDLVPLSAPTSAPHGRSAARPRADSESGKGYSVKCLKTLHQEQRSIESQTITAAESSNAILNSPTEHSIPVTPQEPPIIIQPLPAEYAVSRVLHIQPFANAHSSQFNPLAPFENVFKYKLARFFHESKTTLN